MVILAAFYSLIVSVYTLPAKVAEEPVRNFHAYVLLTLDLQKVPY
jgi:hypothetical protein